MAGSTKIHSDYMTFAYLLESILKEMGHSVYRKPVLIGEDLWKQYDYAFLGVAPLSSLSSTRICETHYAMESMRGRHCVWADDWSFCGFGSSVRYTLDRWNKYIEYKKFPYSEKILDSTLESLNTMISVNERNNAPVLAPMFPWGDHSFLMKDNYDANLITVDPSAWLCYHSLDIPKPFERKRQWVMAALSDHSKWIKKQGFKLPVLYVGNKRMVGVEVLNERDTIRLFAQSYGVLSTGYPSAGSGWWRTRYLNCAWAESIMYCDPIDGKTMSLPYQMSPSYYESLDSENAYEMTAQSQSDWLLRHISTKDTTKAILERLMKK